MYWEVSHGTAPVQANRAVSVSDIHNVTVIVTVINSHCSHNSAQRLFALTSRQVDGGRVRSLLSIHSSTKVTRIILQHFMPSKYYAIFRSFHGIRRKILQRFMVTTMRQDLINCCKHNGPTCCNNKKLWNLLKECAFVSLWFSQYMPIIVLYHNERLFFLIDMESFLFEVRSEFFICNLEIHHTALQKLTAKIVSQTRTLSLVSKFLHNSVLQT